MTIQPTGDGSMFDKEEILQDLQEAGINIDVSNDSDVTFSGKEVVITGAGTYKISLDLFKMRDYIVSKHGKHDYRKWAERAMNSGSSPE
jgi:hypothetical protein